MKPRKRKLRGFEIGINEMFYGFLGMLFIFILFIAFTNTGGGLTDITNWFKDLFNISTDSDEDNYETAKASVEALVCAINSVATGEEYTADGCSKFYGTDNDLGMTGLVAASTNDENSPTVVCDVCCQYASGTKFVKEAMSSQSCQEKKGSVISMTSCDPSAGCTIYNFQLPQEVSEWSEWIRTYGDPQYLVYWQTFPMEQDTWTFKADARIMFGIAVVTALPPLKVAGAGIKFVTKETAKVVMNRMTPKLAKTVGITAFKKEARDLLKQSIVDVATKRFAENKKWMVGKFVGLTTTAMAAQFADSVIEKMEKDSNTILLNSPYDPREKSSLDKSVKGAPVMLHWNVAGPGMSTETAHFVSPCSIDSMKVQKEEMICDTYKYNSEEDLLDCHNPAEYDGNSWVTKLKEALLGSAPNCDISGYLGLDIPYVNDIETIKKTTIIDLIRNILNEGTIRYYEGYSYIKQDDPDSNESEYVELKGLDKTFCDTRLKPELYFSGSGEDNLGKSVVDQHGNKWYFWGCKHDCDLLEHIYWTSVDVCEGKPIELDRYITTAKGAPWGKCEGDLDRARANLWEESDITKDTWETSESLYEKCIPQYNPSEEEIPTQIEIFYPTRYLYLIDTNHDGKFDSYRSKDCKTDVIMIDTVEKTDVPNEENNYCFDERGGYITVLRWAGNILGIGGAVGASILSGPPGWIAFGVATIGGGTIILEEYDNYVGHWPG